jgi:oligoendopeptidase F
VELAQRPIGNRQELERWLEDRSELEAAAQEEAKWRFIRTTQDTGNEQYVDDFKTFVQQIKPGLSKYQNALDQKLLDCPFTLDLDSENYFPYLRKLRSRTEVFAEQNLELSGKEEMLKKQYESIISRMSVEIKGREITMSEAMVSLNSPNRDLREEVHLLVANRRLRDKLEIDKIFQQLIDLRHEMAVNAGFANYRDYQFANLGRFDYSPEDCERFHQAVIAEVMPMVRYLNLRKATLLDLGTLRPWDAKISSTGRSPGRPFKDHQEMLSKSIEVFYKIDDQFGDFLSMMRDINYLDLDARIGKAPGGYNCPMPESGVPFIFMNASGSTRDVKTIMHEGGHAIHSFLSRDLKLLGFREFPSEIAELASMAMEYFSCDHWDVFWSDEEELRLAKIEHLERVINLFPWVAAIDKFQHWVYTNPGHSVDEREAKWREIHADYDSPETDWADLSHYRTILWQAQLHLFKAPFYYIEYALAQFGAIALWQIYKKDPKKALDGYRKALSLGYTKTIGETYATAGVNFDFSTEYIGELMKFLREELHQLYHRKLAS